MKIKDILFPSEHLKSGYSTKGGLKKPKLKKHIKRKDFHGSNNPFNGHLEHLRYGKNRKHIIGKTRYKGMAKDS